jgi:hypothetical protein
VSDAYAAIAPVARGEEETWFEFCRDERLMIQRCSACDKAIFYPRSVCPHCLATEPDWVEASGRGTVFTFAVQHRSARGFNDTDPVVLAIIELEEGVPLMSRVMCAPSQAHIGMPVRVTFTTIGDGPVVPVFVPDDEP